MAQSTQRFRFYKGQPVKRMRQGKAGIILTMLSPEKGKPGPQQTVSQADWDAHGEWRDVNGVRVDDVRKLATA